MNENDSFREDSYMDADQDNPRSNENAEGRDGYRAYNRDNNYQQRGSYNKGQGQRQPRPRFNRSERAYSSDNANNRGFRPQGYNSPNNHNDYHRGQQQYGQQRPQYGNRPQQEGGYDGQRPSFSKNHTTYTHGYRPNQQGGYRQQNEGGYRQQNEGGYRQGQGGYNQQRPRYNNGQQHGYGDYNQQRPRYNNQNGQGGYNQRPAQQKNKQRKPGYDPNAKYSVKKRIEYKEYIEDPDAPIRLNKFLANAGVCSRREADEFIQAGVVKVNGEIVSELGTKVKRTDVVHFHDQLVSIEKKVYVLLNKPKDYVTTSDDPQARKTVMDLVKNCCRERIYPVGRLDRNTTGVLLFTNDGDLASKLTHPKFLKKKIYHVYLDKNVAASDLKRIAEGVELEDGEIHADAISYASDTDKSQVGIEIHSGKNRIVRRIFEHLGYRVMKLDRVMFAGLTKKGLKRGDWRYLTEQEVAMLHIGSFE